MSESIYKWLLPINVSKCLLSLPLYWNILILVEICQVFGKSATIFLHESCLILLSVKINSRQNIPVIKSTAVIKFTKVSLLKLENKRRQGINKYQLLHPIETWNTPLNWIDYYGKVSSYSKTQEQKYCYYDLKQQSAYLRSSSHVKKCVLGQVCNFQYMEDF